MDRYGFGLIALAAALLNVPTPAHAQYSVEQIAESQTSVPRTDAPPYVKEWERLNQIVLCEKDQNSAGCEGTIDLGLRLARAAASSGQLRDALYLLRRSNHAVNMFSYGEAKRNRGDTARAEQIIRRQGTRIGALVTELKAPALYLAGPSLTIALYGRYLDAGQHEKAYAVAEENRKMYAALLHTNNFTNSDAKPITCNLVFDLIEVDGFLYRELRRKKVDVSAARPAALRNYLDKLESLRRTQCANITPWF